LDLGNLKYHNKVIHLNMGKKIKYYCNHDSCISGFKTIRQKVAHHDRNETECKSETTIILNLIRLIRKFYNSFFKRLMNDNEINDSLFVKRGKVLEYEYSLCKNIYTVKLEKET